MTNQEYTGKGVLFYLHSTFTETITGKNVDKCRLSTISCKEMSLQKCYWPLGMIIKINIALLAQIICDQSGRLTKHTSVCIAINYIKMKHYHIKKIHNNKAHLHSHFHAVHLYTVCHKSTKQRLHTQLCFLNAGIVWAEQEEGWGGWKKEKRKKKSKRNLQFQLLSVTQ